LSKFRFTPRVIIGIVLLVFFGVALIIRFLPWDQVFGGQIIRFTSVDGYYYMRLVDSMVHNFPHYTSFDPFNIYPGGRVIEHLGFFYQLLAGFIWLIGLGHPSQHLVNVVASLFPPLLAALTVIPVYFIGKTLFNRWAGMIAAALFAVLPGEYLGRSILGFTDTPVIETFFTTCAVALLLLAIQTAAERRLSIEHFLKLDRGVFLRPVIYSLLAGLFMGVYMMTWAGALLFVFIITLYLVVQFIIDHLAGRSTEYLGIVGFLFFLVNAVMYFPVSTYPYIVTAVVVAIIVPPFMAAISRFLAGRSMRPAYYPVAVVVLGGVLIGILFAISSRTTEIMFSAFRIFAPGGSSAATTMEMQPFLAPQGSFSTVVSWGNFTTSFFMFPSGWNILSYIPGFAFIAYFILLWQVTRQPDGASQYLRLRITSLITVAISVLLLIIYFSSGASLSVLVFGLVILLLGVSIFIWLLSRRSDGGNRIFFLFFIWTLVMLVLTLAQRRFAYYFVVNVAILSAWLAWQAAWRYSLRKAVARPERPPEEVAAQKPAAAAASARPARQRPHESARAKRRRRRQAAPRGVGTYRFISALVAAAIFLVVFLPNIVKADQVASQPAFAPSDGWLDALTWMKDNTPEPLGFPGAYYDLYNKDFVYPASAYGVTSWWDYGYWITRIAHRIPSANPSQNPVPITNIANLFLSENDTVADNVTHILGSSYIIGDYATATSKFWAIATWAGEPLDRLIPTYYIRQGTNVVAATLYTPDYYRTFFVRLYNFDGKAVTTVKPIVVTFTIQTDSAGNRYRLVTATKPFDSYDAAQAYVQQQGPATNAIISSSPFVSPVPLEAVKSYKLVYSSKTAVNVSGVGSISEVKVFEHTTP
jgi:oligosaccharyl transferase (archaeosortase A-associated)